ncbi:MAG: (3R)-3-[(carboxymethyl)amino]fatty acid oxygenase/decarboxylase [Frankia sp.]
MEVSRSSVGGPGTEIHEFDPNTATDEDFVTIAKTVYTEKIVVLKNQDLTPRGFVDLGRRFGQPEPYYEPMYHHPSDHNIFVSGNLQQQSGNVGVPKTGQFWHADYQFMRRPFGLTLVYPQILPKANRGTYFIDMGRAYEKLSVGTRADIVGTRSSHSVRDYFKIRPADVYRPVVEVMRDIERATPAVSHPTTFQHPVTGETVLYNSEGFTFAITDGAGHRIGGDLLRRVLGETGQLDRSFQHDNIHLQVYESGDLIIWDNRSLIHRALHNTTAEPAVSYRVTVHDDHPFYRGIDG